MSDLTTHSSYQPTETITYQPTNGIRVNEHSGSLSMSFVDGQGTLDFSDKTYQTDASELTGHAKGSWQATARGKGGHPSAVIDEETYVTIDGIQARVKDMVKAQMLAVDSQGNYYRPSEFPNLRQEESEAAQNQLPDSKDIPAEMPQELAAAVNDAIGDIPQELLDVTTSIGISAALGHTSVDAIARDYANKTGKDIGESSQRVQFVIDAYQSQTDSHLMKHCGLIQADLPAFYEWAKHPANEVALKTAINSQIYGSKMNSWNQLANKYMHKVPPSPEALARAKGVETRKGNTGETLVKVQGMWMTSKVAAGLGYL